MRSVTFYMDNIQPGVVHAQKRVFDHFGIELEQVKTKQTHGQAIDLWLDNEDWDEVAIFDIDCIPLHKNVLNKASYEIINQNTPFPSTPVLYGAAQIANHIENSNIYCSPAFCCFSRELWEKTGKKTFVDIPGYDVGDAFSQVAKQKNLILKLLYPSHCEVPMWDLVKPKEFGLGTTYENEVYHSFLSRQGHDSAIRFINKCDQVIQNNK